MTPTFIYLHGLGSSPDSKKATFLRGKLSAWHYELRAPDLNVPDFAHLSLGAMIERVDEEVAACAEGPVFLVAASMGASVAVHYLDTKKQGSARRISKLLLLAPSFDFVENRIRQIGQDGMARWQESGWLPYYHSDFGRHIDLHYGIVEELATYEKYPLEIAVPTYVIHGRQDVNVSYHQSERFAADKPNVQLELVDSDHSLSNQLPLIWLRTVDFFDLCGMNSDSSGIQIVALDLWDSSDIIAFDAKRAEVLDLLKRSYAGRYIGDQANVDRWSRGNFTAYLAYDGQRLVGCSIVSKDGKRCATVVEDCYRNNGLARAMLCASLKNKREQYTEIRTDDVVMARLLDSCGFAPIRTESALMELMGRLQDLVIETRSTPEGLVYTRRSQSRDGVVHEFIMYARCY